MGFLKSLKQLLPSDSPDYKEGRKMGEQYAKKDAPQLQSGGRRPAPADASQKARSYTGQLEAEGRSEDFIKGFRYGYRRQYKVFISLYFDA